MAPPFDLAGSRDAPLRGFTLVELLIALSLVGLITLLLFGGLRLGARAWEGVEATADRTAELRVARNFLERALLQARMVSLTLQGETRHIFSGDSETLELATPLSEHVGIPGLYVVRLMLEKGREPRLLMTRWLLHPDVLAGGEDIPEWAWLDADSNSLALAGPLDEDLASGAFGTTLLIEDVGDFEIAYFGAREGEEELAWHQDWLEQPEPPLAVRIRLTTSERTWPDLLVRLPQLRP